MLRAAVSAEDMGQRALAAGRSDFFLKKKRMLRAAVSAEDMGQRALAAGRSDLFVYKKKAHASRGGVGRGYAGSARSPQVYYYIW